MAFAAHLCNEIIHIHCSFSFDSLDHCINGNEGSSSADSSSTKEFLADWRNRWDLFVPTCNERQSAAVGCWFEHSVAVSIEARCAIEREHSCLSIVWNDIERSNELDLCHFSNSMTRHRRRWMMTVQALLDCLSKTNKREQSIHANIFILDQQNHVTTEFDRSTSRNSSSERSCSRTISSTHLSVWTTIQTGIERRSWSTFVSHPLSGTRKNRRSTQIEVRRSRSNSHLTLPFQCGSIATFHSFIVFRVPDSEQNLEFEYVLLVFPCTEWKHQCPCSSLATGWTRCYFSLWIVQWKWSYSSEWWWKFIGTINLVELDVQSVVHW